MGLLLTAAGSAYYHLLPDNERLFWDRLPMTIAFMSLIVAQIVDRISVRAGLALLAPMLLVGVASVVYWLATERAGAGTLDKKSPALVARGFWMPRSGVYGLAMPVAVISTRRSGARQAISLERGLPWPFALHSASVIRTCDSPAPTVRMLAVLPVLRR